MNNFLKDILRPTHSLYRGIGDYYLSQGKKRSAYRAYNIHACNYPFYREYSLECDSKFDHEGVTLSSLKPNIYKYNFVPSFSSLKPEFQGWSNMVFVHPTKTGGTTFRDPLEQAIRHHELILKGLKREGLKSYLNFLHHYSGKNYLKYLSHGSINNDVNAKAVIDLLSSVKFEDITGSFLIAHGIKANGLINALEESVQNKVKRILIQRNPRKRLVSIVRSLLKNNPDFTWREMRDSLLDNSLFRAYIDDYSSQALLPGQHYENLDFDCIFDVTDEARLKCLQSLFLSSNYLPNVIYPEKVNRGGIGNIELEAKISDLTKQFIDDKFICLDEQFYSSNPPSALKEICNLGDISDQENLHPLVMFVGSKIKICYTHDLF